MYSSELSRLRSFDTWPIGLSQKPQEMAEAGFFYTGKSDKVICYYCNGRLKDWTPEDQPWVVHARFFKFCTHVLVMKGEEYVQSAPYEEIKAQCHQTVYNNNMSCLKACTSSSIICKICLEEEMNSCFIPCGHAVCCAKCSLSIGNKCPICRRVFNHITRLYF